MGRETPLGFARDARELGEWMRRIRGDRGLRELAAESEKIVPGSHVSKSTLHRYESGVALPPLQHAASLDALYGAGGWIELSMSALWKPSWNPWRGGWPERCHSHRWPAEYSGAVWIELRPSRDSVDVNHDVELRWGPWRRRFTACLPESGLTIWTGKAPDIDGIARTLDLTLSQPAFALFGAGTTVLDHRAIDLRDGWELRDHNTEDPGRAQGPGDVR